MEPKDTGLFELFVAAVRDGLGYISSRLERKKYISGYFNWVKLRWRVNGLPDFEWQFFGGPKDYKSAFRPDRELPSDSEDGQPGKRPSFESVVTYLQSKQSLAKHLAANEELFERHAKLFIEYAIDRYIHVTGGFEFSRESLMPIYLPLEAYLSVDRLPVNIVVPILFVIPDTHQVKFSPDVSITRMTDDFQVARSRRGQFGGAGVDTLIQPAATHAVVLESWSFENDDLATFTQTVSTTERYPIRLIDLFFASVRIVSGLDTGYAQLLLSPMGWANGYTERLPQVEGTTVKRYPSWFEDGGWSQEHIPRLTVEQIHEVGSVFCNPRSLTENGKNPKLEVAIQRLNQAFLREAQQDAILDVTIGIESLLSDGNEEMTHKLATRTAALYKLLPLSGLRPKQVFGEMKKVYGYRSAVVHGDITQTEKRRELVREAESISTMTVALEHFRNALRVLAANPKYLTITEIDFDLLLGNAPAQVPARQVE